MRGNLVIIMKIFGGSQCFDGTYIEVASFFIMDFLSFYPYLSYKIISKFINFINYISYNMMK